MRKRSKKSFDLVLVIVDGSREGRANAASPPHSVFNLEAIPTACGALPLEFILRSSILRGRHHHHQHDDDDAEA